MLGVDLETRDPRLLSHGPGGLRRDGDVVGVSLSTGKDSWYFPFGHLGGGNMDREVTIRFLKETLERPNLWLIGANLQYELEWLDYLGIEPKGKLIDIQVAEALLDEERERDFTLGTLCQDYLGEGKDETLLREAASAYGVDPKSELWKLPSQYVGAYGEFDAKAPVLIFERQLERMRADDLLPIFELESKLLPLLWYMRKQGIPVDLEGAKCLTEELRVEEENIRMDFFKLYGFHIDEWSGKQIEGLCQRLKINFPHTPKGNASFTGDWLSESTEKPLRMIADIRELNRLRTTFIDGWIFGHVGKDGRVHPQWKQLMSDEGGTRTGRMAASNPNPQQVPSRNEKLAPRLRALFIPPEGQRWAKKDYSQQEPRILVHFAYLCKMAGADAVRLAYINNKEMDIYKHLAEAAGISRRNAKDLTLGRMYGMGKAKMATKLGIGLEEADRILAGFDKSVPFVKEIADECTRLAQSRGWIKTLCGRKRHFNYWEPTDSFNMRKQGLDTRPLERKAAEAKWPTMRLQRANAHKALNSLIQGSAADMTKACMLKIWEEHGKIPLMQVHDEVNYGVDSDAEAEELKHIAETCVEMTVPIVAELSVGDHWK
jgi:DNA polymerase-1